MPPCAAASLTQFISRDLPSMSQVGSKTAFDKMQDRGQFDHSTSRGKNKKDNRLSEQFYLCSGLNYKQIFHLV